MSIRKSINAFCELVDVPKRPRKLAGVVISPAAFGESLLSGKFSDNKLSRENLKRRAPVTNGPNSSILSSPVSPFIVSEISATRVTSPSGAVITAVSSDVASSSASILSVKVTCTVNTEPISDSNNV